MVHSATLRTVDLPIGLIILRKYVVFVSPSNLKVFTGTEL